MSINDSFFKPRSTIVLISWKSNNPWNNPGAADSDNHRNIAALRLSAFNRFTDSSGITAKAHGQHLNSWHVQTIS